MNNLMIYSDLFHLTQGDFDQYMQVKPYSIFNLFQEVATEHASNLNTGYYQLMEDHKIWILLRSKYQIIHPLIESQIVRVETWPRKVKRIEYDREYRILDENNNILVKGTSIWCIVDTKTKMISRDPIIFNGTYYQENNFAQDLGKIPKFDLSSKNFVYQHIVRKSELDRNNHMNNAKYSDLVLNALNLQKNEIIEEIEINFLNEIKLDDAINLFEIKEGNNYYIIGQKEDTDCFRSRIILKQ